MLDREQLALHLFKTARRGIGEPMKLSQAEKFAFIKWAKGRDGSEASLIERARKSVKISRTYASGLNCGKDVIKSKKILTRLEVAFERVVPEPGSAAYRLMHAELRQKLESRSREDIVLLDRYVIPAAFGQWASVALDETKPIPERLTKGNSAQRALFEWCHKLGRERRQYLDHTSINEPDDVLADRGRRVIEALVDLIKDHPRPPTALFDEDVAEPERLSGYRMLRTKLLNDKIGWYGCGCLLNDHAQRAELYRNGYEGGLTEDLMWLFGIAPHVFHPNNAWNLAMHAGEWSDSVRFAAVLFQKYPNLLYESVCGLPPIYKDQSVWPGVAALWIDSRFRELDSIREQLAKDQYTEMMNSVRQMAAGIRARANYVEVLRIGTSK